MVVNVPPGSTSQIPTASPCAPTDVPAATFTTPTGASGVAASATGIAASATGAAPGNTGVATGASGVVAGATGIAVSATGVAPGDTGVAPSDTVVAPGDSDVSPDVSVTPPAASVVPADRLNFPAGASNKGKSPMIEEDIPVPAKTFRQIEEDRLGEEAARRLHKEEMDKMEKERAEAQRKRQEEVLESAKFYNKDDWLNIRAQMEANTSLSKTLLGDDVSKDNFLAQMAALIMKKQQALAEQLFKEMQNRPLTLAQQKAYTRVFNSPMVYLLRVEMVINPPWIMPILGIQELASPKANGFCPEQTATGKDISNPFMAVMICQKSLGYSNSPFIHVLRIGLVINPPGYVIPTGRVIVPAGRYIVPTGSVIVATSRYIVPAGDLLYLNFLMVFCELVAGMRDRK
nr:JmjC domain-containing protein [Tanacetum cinerariifolium]